MSQNKKQEPEKLNIKIKSLDIDKAEYQQIVLSQSNFQNKDYFKKDWD